MTDENGDFIRFAKRVSYIGGAIIVSSTIIGAVTIFLWGMGTRPIMDKIEDLQAAQAEERIARQRNDSLMVEQIASLGEALSRPAGSESSRRAAHEATEGPADLKRVQRPLRR